MKMEEPDCPRYNFRTKTPISSELIAQIVAHYDGRPVGARLVAMSARSQSTCVLFRPISPAGLGLDGRTTRFASIRGVNSVRSVRNTLACMRYCVIDAAVGSAYFSAGNMSIADATQAKQMAIVKTSEMRPPCATTPS